MGLFDSGCRLHIQAASSQNYKGSPLENTMLRTMLMIVRWILSYLHLLAGIFLSFTYRNTPVFLRKTSGRLIRLHHLYVERIYSNWTAFRKHEESSNFIEAISWVFARNTRQEFDRRSIKVSNTYYLVGHGESWAFRSDQMTLSITSLDEFKPRPLLDSSSLSACLVRIPSSRYA